MIHFAPDGIVTDTARRIAASGLALVNTEDWFVFKQGSLYAPVYLQLRNLGATTDWTILIQRMAELKNWALRTGRMKEKPVGVYGIPEGAVQLSGALAYALNMHPVRIDSRERTRGVKQELLGAQPGDEVILLEDASSSGISIIKEAERLRSLGVKVNNALIIATHGLGVGERLQDAGIAAFCLCRSQQIFTALFDGEPGKYDFRTRKAVAGWFKDPVAESERYRRRIETLMPFDT